MQVIRQRPDDRFYNKYPKSTNFAVGCCQNSRSGCKNILFWTLKETLTTCTLKSGLKSGCVMVPGLKTGGVVVGLGI